MPEKQLLEAEIAKLTGKTSTAPATQQDASLLGGAVVQVGSTIYDGSVNGQLERIREQLVEVSCQLSAISYRNHEVCSTSEAAR